MGIAAFVAFFPRTLIRCSCCPTWRNQPPSWLPKCVSAFSQHMKQKQSIELLCNTDSLFTFFFVENFPNASTLASKSPVQTTH